jgi:hypothetical protein
MEDRRGRAYGALKFSDANQSEGASSEGCGVSWSSSW